MAKKKKASKKSSGRGKKQADPVGDFLKGLTKRAKNGEIRGILTIVIGSESGQTQLQWAGQVAPAEVALPLITAQRVFVDITLEKGRQAEQ